MRTRAVQLIRPFRHAVCAGLLLALPACTEELEPKPFILRSSAFVDGATMAKTYACGRGESPPLSFSQVPEEAASIAIVAEDIDRISGPYTHWTIWNLPRKSLLVQDIENNPIQDAIMGTADDGMTEGYLAPCPPDNETHRIVFRAYGLDTTLSLKKGADRAAVDKAMSGHVIGKAMLTGKAVGP